MKKFQFRLDSVLRWRKSQLQLERATLSRLLGEEQRLKLELQALADQRREALATLQRAGYLETVELRALSAFLVGSTARETVMHEQVARMQGAIAAQRSQTVVAERNVKLLETLREKRLDAWTAEFHKHLDAAAEEAWLAAHHT